MKKIFIYLLTLFIFIGTGHDANSQRTNRNTEPKEQAPAQLYQDLEYRLIGPFRGGRSAAVTGIPGDENVFYQGATGGGVWKTTDAGETWVNVSDGYFGGTIGAVEVAHSDPNIVIASGGEVTVRGNVSHGYGIWKSEDKGETWYYIGLKEGQYIPRVRIHPDNPNIIYAAVLGHLFGPNEERGVYRSVDGGISWEKILYVDENTGACDLILDPTNPRIIYASTWRVRRTPYSLESGGEGSALWKSRDGGDTWTNLSNKDGMPKSTTGIIGVTLSAANPKKVYAIVESENGGLFVSNDAGEKWSRVSDDRNLRQRAWYYSRIYSDPEDEDIIYVLNVGFHKSSDGGRTFESVRTPHSDHHDLWIDPLSSKVMIVGDDGGAQVSKDGGKKWSTMMNQPTAQFFRVITDNHFPYRIYGAQQDNSTVRIDSRAIGSGSITENNWESTAGGESGWIAPDPKNNEIVYGGSYGGYLVRLNHETGSSRRVDIWPDNPMGWGADSLEQRFQWNFPILFSRHDDNTLYAASNYLFRTTNEGQSWTMISPDLTRNDKSRMGPSGGPITRDNTSVEYYGTIFAIAESSLEKDILWCGSDDGLIYITVDGGENWENVTPANSIIPEWTMINSIEADPFNPGGIYVAATSYKNDDYKPYLCRTTDYGKTWTRITNGIAPDHFTRVVRADPVRKGLLYCGTESGMYISFDDGASWNPFQLNLPVVPVTDLAVKDNDLIVATQGRSFYVFDYLNLIRDMNTGMANAKYTLFKPVNPYKIGGRGGRGGSSGGSNPLPGAVVSFYLREAAGENDNIRLDFCDSKGSLIRSFRTNTEGLGMGSHLPYDKLDVKKGMNHFSWDLSYPGALRIPGMILWSGSLNGPGAVPGKYSVRMVVNNDSTEYEFELLPNSLSSSSVSDQAEQFKFLIEVRDKLTETHQAILDIRDLRKDLISVEDKLDKSQHADILKTTEVLKKRITAIEEALYQTKNRSGQDPLNYPIRLGNKLAALNGVAGTGDYKPTDQAYEVRNQLVEKIDVQLDRFYSIRENDIPELNSVLKEKGIDYIR
ncbi:MAG TPA: hypothetical protein VMW76_03435 [Bacteroidales bacterium]|nr:hypothetical protein [Bacteroidales bacterium]